MQIITLSGDLCMYIYIPFYTRGEEEGRHNFGSIRGYKGHYQSCFIWTWVILRESEREREREREI